MTNFGQRDRLTVAGVPVGRLLAGARRRRRRAAPAGSCIGVVVTDAPVGAADCARLARRIGLGLARAGSMAHHGSGEIFLAVGTTAGRPRRRARRQRRAWPAARWTRCSRPSWTPPRRRC